MSDETVDAGSGAKPGKQELVRQDRRQTGQRHAQRVVVEHRHAKQRRGEKQEIVIGDTKDQLDCSRLAARMSTLTGKAVVARRSII